MNAPRGWIRRRGRKLEAVIVLSDGTQRTRSTRFDVGQEEDAQRFLDVLLAELGGGEGASSSAGAGGLTLRAWGERWIAERKARRIVSADNEDAQLRFHVYPQLGDVAIVSLTKTAMLEWVRGLPSRTSVRAGDALSPRSVHHIAATVRRLLAEAVDRELVDANPCTWRANGSESSRAT